MEIRKATLLATLVIAPLAHAGVMMQGFYWNVPSAPTSGANLFWDDRLALNANLISNSGFTAIWIPPVIKANSGGFSMGYDPYDDYDLGDKNQKGSIPTRFGNRDTLQRMCAMLRANGIDIYSDVVDNHRDGDDGNFNFIYNDAYGNATGGRFSKSFYDFHPNVPEDPDVFDNPEVSFGRDLAPVNGQNHYVYNGLINALDWQTKALDLEGYRFDYVKGISTDWLSTLLNAKSMVGKFAVGEFYDGSVSNVQWWLGKMHNRSCAFDFPLRFMFKSMCDSPTSFNMASLDHAGVAGVAPLNAVTFVENHDTDNDSSQAIHNNKILGYAYILTSEGYPCVFYRDWSTDPGCYGAGMQARINNLVWIHENLASGTTINRWKNNLIDVYERTGAQHLLVGLNNNVNPNNINQGYDYKLTCATGFGPNVKLHDYTGDAPDVTTDANGNVTLDLPPAINGQGYVAYAPSAPATKPRIYSSTTQEFDGAKDLDIKPANHTALLPITKLFCQGGTTFTGSVTWDATGLTANSQIYIEVRNSGGTLMSSQTYPGNGAQGALFTFNIPGTGTYIAKIRSYNTPTTNTEPAYAAKFTYTAPKTFPGGVVSAY